MSIASAVACRDFSAAHTVLDTVAQSTMKNYADRGWDLSVRAHSCGASTLAKEVCGSVRETIMSRPAVASIEELRETGMLHMPLVPERAIIQEVRLTGEWYGNYRKGAPVLDAYIQIVNQVIR